MVSIRKYSILLVILLLFFPAKCLISQDSISTPIDHNIYDDWHFRLSPYAWFINIKGELVTPFVPTEPGVPPPSQLPEEEPRFNIDLSFQDIRSSLKFASMISGQYRNKHIIIQFNSSILILEGSGITPLELLIQNTELKLWYYSGDLGIGYRFLTKPKIEIDGLLGTKFLYTKVRLNTEFLNKVEVETTRDKFWYNPVLGINVYYRPIDRLELGLYADIGTRFKVGDLTTQFMFVVNGMITKWFYLSLGYRYYYVDVPREDAVLTGNIRGFVFKIGFQF